MVGFKRRLVFWAVVVLLGSTLSGCVVRPLGWGYHGYRHGEHYDGYEESHRNDGHREDWHH